MINTFIALLGDISGFTASLAMPCLSATRIIIETLTATIAGTVKSEGSIVTCYNTTIN